MSDLLFPLQEGGGQGPAVGLWVLYPQRLYILIVLPSQQQKLILLVEISDPSVHPVPRVGHLVRLLPQVHLISGNAVLEVFYLTLPLGQLFCKLLAGSLFLLHPFPLGLQIVFAQGRILGLCLSEPGLRIFLLLDLITELLLQFFQIHFHILKLVLELQCFGMRSQVGPSLHAQHILIIAAVLITDDRGIPHGRLKIPQRVLQGIHALHGADHGGEILICQHLKRFVQNFLHFRGAESLFGQLWRAHLDEKLNQLFILADIPELKHPVIDQLLIGTGCFCPVVFIANQIGGFCLLRGSI